jgi:hypothetical protein
MSQDKSRHERLQVTRKLCICLASILETRQAAIFTHCPGVPQGSNTDLINPSSLNWCILMMSAATTDSS